MSPRSPWCPHVPHTRVPGEGTELSPTAAHGTEKPLPPEQFPRGFPSPFSPNPILQQGWSSPRSAQPRAPTPPWAVPGTWAPLSPRSPSLCSQTKQLSALLRADAYPYS